MHATEQTVSPEASTPKQPWLLYQISRWLRVPLVFFFGVRNRSLVPCVFRTKVALPQICWKSTQWGLVCSPRTRRRRSDQWFATTSTGIRIKQAIACLHKSNNLSTRKNRKPSHCGTPGIHRCLFQCSNCRPRVKLDAHVSPCLLWFAFICKS